MVDGLDDQSSQEADSLAVSSGVEVRSLVLPEGLAAGPSPMSNEWKAEEVAVQDNIILHGPAVVCSIPLRPHGRDHSSFNSTELRDPVGNIPHPVSQLVCRYSV